MLPHHEGDIFNHSKVLQILSELDKRLESVGLQRKLRMYAVGGTVLLLKQLRETSKDIDFIVPRKDFMVLSGHVPQLEKSENVRIDLFPDGDLPEYQYPDYHLNAEAAPFKFNQFELFYLDKADMLLTKILASRDEDLADIQRLVPSSEIIPLEQLRSRYTRIVPDSGKANILKSRFETFVEKFYKAKD